MINFSHRFWLMSALIGLFLCGERTVAAALPPPVDIVNTPHRMNINESMLWCRSDPGSLPEQVLAGGCEWRAMSLDDTLGGVNRSVFWMRVAFRNSAQIDLLRWLKIGHSRTRERVIYLRDGEGWQRHESGLAFPLEQLSGDPATTRGYLPLFIPAGQTVEALLRVETTSWVDLRTSLLEPDAAMRGFERRELWVILASGGLLLAIVFGLLLLWRQRC